MARRVLYAASTESHLLQFHLPYLERFQQAGWTVHAACGGSPSSIPFADEVIPLPLEKRMAALGNWRAARLLRQRLRREPYTLLCVHTSLAACFARLAAAGLRRRPRIVHMVHGYLFDGDTPWGTRQFLLTAERVLAPWTDLVLTMNRWDFETAKRCRLGKRMMRVPGIGVDFSKLEPPPSSERAALRAALGIPPDAFALIYAAEFSRRKSQEVLIQAMAKLPDSVFLILAGEGERKSACQETAETLGLRRRILFPGQVRDMARWYAAVDAAVTASRSEGLPFNVMEAMHAGLPVTASAVKGHVDLIRDGENGLLYPYGDSDACAERIGKLAASPEWRTHLGEQARVSVEPYRLERVMPIVWDAYMSLFPSATDEKGTN